MPVPLGTCTFPGIAQIMSARFTLGHGISPSVATIEIPRQGDGAFPLQGGTLEFRFGDARIAFPDCRLDGASLSASRGGRCWSLRIYDRRWRWRFGAISGCYNLKRAEGGAELRIEAQRSPRQLAELCLQAMGETRYDVSALPDAGRPAVQWNADNPARALADLVDAFDCRVVLGLDDQVRVWPRGVGSGLPTSGAMDLASAAEPAELPGELVLLAAPHRVELDLDLEAVGQETDGRLVPIDELSYCPGGGWAEADVDHFQVVADRHARQLARRSVYRWYRIQEPIRSVPLPERAPQDLARWQVLPLVGDRVEVVRDASEGGDGYRTAVPLVYGVWCDVPRQARNRQPELATVGEAPESASTPLGTLPLGSEPSAADGAATLDLGAGARLDCQRGLVIFDRPWVRLEGDDPRQPAQLRLRTAVRVRDATSGAILRGMRRRVVNPSLAGSTCYEQQADLPSWTVVRDGEVVADNAAELAAAADLVLDRTQARLGGSQTLSVYYAGLLPLAPDGAIQQVTWSVGPRGATTRASLNQEESESAPSYRERRVWERTVDLLQKTSRTGRQTT